MSGVKNDAAYVRARKREDRRNRSRLKHERAIRADAWDAGLAAGYCEFCGCVAPVSNPYRDSGDSPTGEM